MPDGYRSNWAYNQLVLANGTLNAANATASFVAMAVTFVGMFIGQYVRNLVEQELFRVLFFAVMLVLGVNLAFIR